MLPTSLDASSLCVKIRLGVGPLVTDIGPKGPVVDDA